MGERRIDAGTTAMLVDLAPLIVVLLAGLVLREDWPRLLVLGVPLSFLVVVLIGVESLSGPGDPLGVTMALAAALLYAGCTLIQMRLLATIDGVTCTWLSAVVGTAALLPWEPRLLADLAAAPASAVLGLVYLGVFPAAIAFTTWAYVLSRSTAGRTSATTYVVPALAVMMSWLVLGEVPTLITVTGGLVRLAGVFVTRLPGRRPRPSGSAASARETLPV